MDIPTVVREKAQDFKETELQDYVERVFNFLKGMKPGYDIHISKLTREKNRELFLEVCKLYMRQHDYQDGLTFTKGFVRIYKSDITFIKSPKGFMKLFAKRNKI